jgi:hypothetical protein
MQRLDLYVRQHRIRVAARGKAQRRTRRIERGAELGEVNRLDLQVRDGCVREYRALRRPRARTAFTAVTAVRNCDRCTAFTLIAEVTGLSMKITVRRAAGAHGSEIGVAVGGCTGSVHCPHLVKVGGIGGRGGVGERIAAGEPTNVNAPSAAMRPTSYESVILR